MENTTWLASFLNKQREIIEAAETPFAKLAIFILPILAPLVPAFLTGLHVFKLLQEIFTFQYADSVTWTLSVIVSVVLEMLGYVGAISFIQAIYRWMYTKNDAYMLPSTLNGLAYIFYLLAMFLINYQLGKYFGTPNIVNNIVGLLSFITVPTSLLAANHLSQKEEDEKDYILRQERRSDNLERYKIKHGKFLESSKKVSRPVETFQKLSNDWRKVRPNLSRQELERLANLSPQEMQQWASETGLTYKTISNWRTHAKNEIEGE
jgi:hypothetical protein